MKKDTTAMNDRLRKTHDIPANGKCFTCKFLGLLYPVVQRDRRTWRGVCKGCYDRIADKASIGGRA